MIQNWKQIKDTIFSLVDFSYDGALQVTDYDGVLVRYDGTATIGCCSKATFARGCFLLAQQLSAGKTSFELRQKAAFDTVGVMLDMSRNGVLTVDAVKKYINFLAALGLNMLMLYTEDTYEIPEYPYFGYLRGRYSCAELREIDTYAESMGVEVIPCVQTLAHLAQFLHWPGTEELRDTGDILLIDEEKTYAFVEAELRALRAAFHSGRIHIGMDEAHNVGLGAYLDKHGLQNRFDLLNRHLTRVVALCKKYGFKPMMWSDMFFRLGSARKDYYDSEVSFAPEVLAGIPDVEMVYWDYYHSTYEDYDSMMAAHKLMQKELVFAGGIGMWYGSLPWHDNILANTPPAMQACLHNKVPTVFMTMWGDDGCETDRFYGVPYLPLISEYCYRGEACTQADMAEVSEFLTKLPYEKLALLRDYNPVIGGEQTYGKSFTYSNLLYGMGLSAEKCGEAAKRYRGAAEALLPCVEKAGASRLMVRQAYLLMRLCAEKAQIQHELRDHYHAGDREYLANLANSVLPELVHTYERLAENHRALWMAHNKPFGYEVISFRYGGAMQQTKDMMATLHQYLNGELPQIAELEQTVLPTGNYLSAGQQYTPSASR